mmetsp:Transcript_21059/g.59243  ORF Transcript_21059/g.59243 Transcript_21059/m.59243 type:complete len:205 (-) Transcript_21059:150-764(-)|eukprot:CAMPEP_0119124078 /NCGR_PEP_ID=MMETSP1310-20130426/3800_1 /TAXON_ID=464262 /ORGANISM="Genus nov. species nov., Strain RCC2339" /LENGTH=204 /DNA_ID=CAMNT_0007113967 /DNA_START=270 /DNA_END=884 /DNA_ORIENTATION=+
MAQLVGSGVVRKGGYAGHTNGMGGVTVMELPLENNGSAIGLNEICPLALRDRVGSTEYGSFVTRLNELIAPHFHDQQQRREELSRTYVWGCWVAGCLTHGLSNFYYIPKYRRQVAEFTEKEYKFAKSLRDLLAYYNSTMFLPSDSQLTLRERHRVSVQQSKGYADDLKDRYVLLLEVAPPRRTGDAVTALAQVESGAKYGVQAA